MSVILIMHNSLCTQFKLSQRGPSHEGTFSIRNFKRIMFLDLVHTDTTKVGDKVSYNFDFPDLILRDL